MNTTAFRSLVTNISYFTFIVSPQLPRTPQILLFLNTKLYKNILKQFLLSPIVPTYSSSVSFYFFFKLYLLLWLYGVACEILVPQPGIESVPAALELQSPNHWAAREFPYFFFF